MTQTMSLQEQAERLAPHFITPDLGDTWPDPADLGNPAQFDGLGLVVVRLQAGDTPATLWPHVPDALGHAVAAIDPTQPARVYATYADVHGILGATAWDWQDYIPKGTLIVAGGAQESGKTTVAQRIAASYIMGWDWPDGTPYTGEKGSVVWAEGEAGQRINTNRIKAWGVDMTKIVVTNEALGDFFFGNEADRNAFWELMRRPGVKLGVLDSLSGIHGGKESDAEMQGIIKPFAELARDCNKPIIITHHLNKPLRGQTDVLTLARLRGSGTITQTARIVWGIDLPDPALPDTRRLQVLKSSLGIKPEPLGFTIGEKGVEWCDAPQEAKKETLQDKAVDLLLVLLRKGPMRATDLRAEIEGAGLSWNATHRAKAKLGIVVVKREGVWHWGLPHHEQ